MFGRRKKDDAQGSEKQDNKQEKIYVPGSIPECEKLIREILGNSSDIIIRTFDTAKEKALVVFVDGLTNLDLINRDIIAPLKSDNFTGDISHSLQTTFIATDDMSVLVEKVLSGETALFYGSNKKVHIIEMRYWEHRPIEEPHSENVIRGPKEGFTETMAANTAMIRRKIKTPELRFEAMKLGRRTRTIVMLVYINGIVNQEVLSELRNRLSGISTDAILETGYIEQFIDKNTFSPVSGIGLTQKPDIVAQRILEGRVAVLVEGTPHALTIPEMFMDNFRTAEDSYNNIFYVNFMRGLRGLALFVTTIFPGLSIAIFTFNQEMLPSVFLTTLVSSSMRTPMPISLEILLLTVLFELIKESGTRMPRAIGSAITVVGSLIIGEAAVNAGIVSAPSVIIVATAALTSFAVPSLTTFILVYRMLFWFLGSVMGTIGIGAGLVIMITQLSSEESFGRPILSSFSKNEMKDSLLRFPIKELKYRPTSVVRENVKRQR